MSAPKTTVSGFHEANRNSQANDVLYERKSGEYLVSFDVTDTTLFTAMRRRSSRL